MDASTPKPSPLTIAADHAKESMQILLDYLKIASEIHTPDQYIPGVTAVSNLAEALDQIERLRDGNGRSDSIYIGHISAEG